LPIPPTGKELVLKGCYFMHVKDGKVVECFGYSDMLGILQQAGIVPPPGKQ
jgi:predicted ester cyclase